MSARAVCGYLPRNMPGARDDAVLPWTRRASLIVVCVLIPALVILWGFPGRTDRLWAWTIKAPLTPIFMGSGYGAGAYFFVRVYLSRKWHPASAGVFSAAAFAALMLITTIVHWDKFNHGHAPALAATAFYLWVGVYIVSPVAVGWIWLANHRRDPGPQPGDHTVSASVTKGAGAFAAVCILAGLVLLIRPSIGVDHWCWPLTPLTARVLGCFTCQVGIGALLLFRDPRWSAWRLLIQTFFVACGLLLIGAIRCREGFDTGNVMTWLYLGGLAATALALLALYRRMEATSPRA
jgi:hypothetical protein